MATRKRQYAGIGDAAVKEATGCDWARWIDALDRAGCATKTHKEIAALIARKWPKTGPWWTQMVTVGYEQARGLRVKHETPRGFQVSSSKTIGVALRSLFGAWKDPKRRAQWLKDHHFTVRKATAHKSMRITWVDGKTNVDVNFLAKGARKSHVAVEHAKLATKKEVEKMRRYWGRALTKLKAELEG